MPATFSRRTILQLTAMAPALRPLVAQISAPPRNSTVALVKGESRRQNMGLGAAVIDGYEGMEGNGPGSGTPVPSRLAIASTDYIAADRVGVEAMRINPDWLGYLRFCSEFGCGQYDLAKIDVRGVAQTLGLPGPEGTPHSWGRGVRGPQNVSARARRRQPERLRHVGDRIPEQ